MPAVGQTKAVALVLPGGKADSFDPSDPGQLTAIRMRPFARVLHSQGRHDGLDVWTLRYRYRGWNGHDTSPVSDAEWALSEVRRRHARVPVVVVGHSMGGRTALWVAGDSSVRGVCALAPWTEAGDPVEQLAGRGVLIAHGSTDLMTSARASHRYDERAATGNSAVGRLLVVGDTHAMLFGWRTWHRLAAGFTLGTLGMSPMPGHLRRAFEAGAKGHFSVWT